MHDVAAVAPAVAGEQATEGERVALAVLAVAGPRPAGELLQHGARHERAQPHRHQRVEVAHPADEQHEERERAHGRRHGELAAQVGERRAAPRDQRSDPAIHDGSLVR